jgi:phospholipid transport system substrate-binding protein
MIGRRVVLAGVLAVCSGGAGAEVPAAVPVAALLDGLKAAMKAGRGVPFAARAARLGPIVEASFDLKTILVASVGPRWSGFGLVAQVALLAAFRDFTVATWVANFDADEGQRFEIDPDVRAVGADRVVTTRIVPANGEATRLDYVMRDIAGAWRAVDILVDGSISRAAVQRSDFRALLRDGNPAGLIQNLRDKAAELAR